MVGAVEKEFCSAGDGAEFSNDQFILVDGIVIEDIVFFKLSWVSDKIVINRVIACCNVGILDDVF